MLAAVTSLPNAVAAVYLARRGRGAATLSTALNSNTLNAAALAGFALPTFLTALFLLQISSAIDSTPNAWLQPGYVPFTESPTQWLGRLILPWIAIAATQVGMTARLARGSMLEVLGEDYVRTARANGVLARRVFWHHLLRPAITPVISNITVGFGMLLGSAAIVDQVFALGGIGQALLVAVKSGDLMVIMGTALLTFLLISVVSLIVDICQALLDPRVRIA
ncbi:MAG: ABC transporter permease [Streptosporangiaceae bacterium]